MSSASNSPVGSGIKYPWTVPSLSAVFSFSSRGSILVGCGWRRWPNRQIILPAGATKHHWEERLVPFARAELLAVEGKVAGARPFEGSEYVTGPGNKLVQAEGEERAPLGVRGLVGKQQETAEVIEALGGRTSAGRFEQVRGLGHRLGAAGTDPPPVWPIVLPLKPEGCLGPRCYRMNPERCVIGAIWDSSHDGGGQARRIGRRRVVGDPAENSR